MITCAASAPTLVLPPLAPNSSMSSSSDYSRVDDRPVLPPIRDLFRELSASRAPPESPSMTLARLRVSDDDVRGHGSSRPRPPSRSNTDPSPSYPPSNHNAYERSSYSTPDYPGPPSRTLSYDGAGYPPPPPGYRTYDPRQDPRRPVVHPPPPPEYYGRPGMPPTISTNMDGGYPLEDDRTPVARYQSSGMSSYALPDASFGSTAKYECSYCQKAFTRPSSLKIHLNSHTGEKPFVCPVDGCGRSFSVLSNMRRHARHTLATSPPRKYRVRVELELELSSKP
ncbi:hypothetical protein MKEN_00695300 [Mycena kentingensis (nom. inval.)]|nr:hypothetical protein MKEN_00695300 [Mycena kentingensis (nom. inval.)]